MKGKKNAIIVSETSIDSLKKSEELARLLRERILDLARRAGRKGLTINEAERQIGDHKGHSVSPRFSELVRQGALVRVLTDSERPTRRSPRGLCRHITRYDEETGRNVKVHWVPEFTPVRKGKGPDSTRTSEAPSEFTPNKDRS